MSPDTTSSTGLAGQAPDVLGVLRRQWAVLVLCGLAAAALAYLYVKTSEVTYESKSTVLLLALPGETPPGGGLERTLDVETQATVARSTDLLQAIGDKLGRTAAQVRNSSRVEAAPTGNVMFVYFTDDNAEFAANGALTYTEEFLAQRKTLADEKTQSQRDLIQSQINELQAEVEDLTNKIEAEIELGDNGSATELAVLQQRQSLAIRDIATARDQLANIEGDQTPGRIVVDPRTAVSRVGLSMSLAVGGGAALGLVLGAMLALLLDRRDDRYGSIAGPEAVGIQEVGRLSYPVAGGGSDSGLVRRDFARLLARLGFSTGTSTGHRVILLVAVEASTLPPRAMRTVAESLAAEGPGTGLRTTIMSLDRTTPGPGGDPSGPQWQEFAASLTAEKDESDLVLVVAEAFDRSMTSLAVASRVDQTVLLISDATKVSELVAVIEDLESVDARDIGLLVLTRVPPRRRW